MKKYFFLLMLLGLYFCGNSSDVYGREYEITEYHIIVQVQEDGSADITEDITYYFDDKFNGVTRDIDFDKTGGLVKPKVSLITANGPKEYILDTSSKNDESGKKGTYQLKTTGDIVSFRVFETSRDESKTFRYEYTFDDVITVYEDVAIFNRKIVDSNWDVTLQNITIDIVLPVGASKDDIHAFGHGALIGTVSILSEQHIRYQLAYMKQGNNVETLVLFPPTLIPDGNNIVSKKMKSSLLEQEEEFAKEANQARLEAKAANTKRAEKESLGGKIALGLSLIWGGFVGYLYQTFSKKPKMDGSNQYYDQLPGDYTPAEMSYLMHKGSIDRKDISATLMDLIGKKQLLFQIIQNGANEDFIIQINPYAPKVKLKQHESHLIRWFIHTIGDGHQMNLSELKEYSKEVKNAEKFRNSYNKWMKLAKQEGMKNRFFDIKNRVKFVAGIVSLGFSVLAFILLIMTEHWFCMVLMVLGVISLIYVILLMKLTPYGEQQYIKWIGFKNYLMNHKKMIELAELDSETWEKYLPYAMSLGISKNIMGQIPKPVMVKNHTNDDMYDGGWYYYYMMGYAMDNVVTTLDRTISQALSVADSTISSHSGGDGGFSGGSSDGGGGGGGGGAF